MSIEIWLYYFFAILVLTASPGPSSLLCMTKGVTLGWQAAIYSALGSLTAITIIMTLSFTGLGIVISATEMLFNIVKWLGVAYLIYLGYRALTSSQVSYETVNNNLPQSHKQSANFLTGFMVGASNPKAILFFTALFPQFITVDAPLLPQFFIFAITFAVMELAWLSFYGYLGAKSSNWLFTKGHAKIFNRVNGTLFIGAGLALSTSSHR